MSSKKVFSINQSWHPEPPPFLPEKGFRDLGARDDFSMEGGYVAPQSG